MTWPGGAEEVGRLRSGAVHGAEQALLPMGQTNNVVARDDLICTEEPHVHEPGEKRPPRRRAAERASRERRQRQQAAFALVIPAHQLCAALAVAG